MRFKIEFSVSKIEGSSIYSFFIGMDDKFPFYYGYEEKPLLTLWYFIHNEIYMHEGENKERVERGGLYYILSRV